LNEISSFAIRHLPNDKGYKTLQNNNNLSLFPWVMLCFADFNGEFKQITPTLAKLLGREASELDIKNTLSESSQSENPLSYVLPNLFDLIHPQDRQIVKRALLQLSRGANDISFETRLKQSDGHYHWLLWQATPVKEQQGFYAVLTDITAYKPKPSKSLEVQPTIASEDLLLILDSLEALVYVADIETYQILYENQYGRKIFGDLVGKTCWQAFVQQENPCPFCSQHPILTEDGQTNLSHQWECYSPKTQRWYMVHDRAIRWLDGRWVRLEIAYDITERKLVEQSLKLSQDRYMLAVRAGKTGVWDWNLKTNEMYLGPHLKVLLGFSERELENSLEAWMNIIHPDDMKRLRKVSLDYLQQRIPNFEQEYRILDKKGHIRWMIVRGTAMRDKKGRAYRMVGTNTNITERKQFQERLQEQQRLCQGAAQVTHTLLTFPDDERPISSVLKILAHLTNVDRVYIFENYQIATTGETVINQRFSWVNKKYQSYNMPNKWKPLSYTHYLPGWYEILEKNKPICQLVKKFPEPIRSFLASYQVISLLIVPIHFKGQFWGFIGLDDCHTERQWSQYEISVLKIIGDSIRGTLARQQFKESLRQSETKFRSIIENSRDAILVCDKEGLIRFVNPAAEALYQTQKGGLIGQNFCALFEVENFEVENKVDFKFTDLKGHHHVGELQLSKIEWEGEQCNLVSLRDITARKQAEIELQKNKEAAETANRIKSLFLAEMSHEIRGPMSGVLGIGDLLSKTTLTRQQQNYVKMIEHSGQELLTVINDILDFSRIEAGQGLLLTMVEFEPRKLAEEIVNLFAANAQKKGLEILCQLPPHLPKMLCGDPNRLRQILNNLLSNAIKFTKQGEVFLRLSIKSETTTTVVLHFEVRDTGIGIEPHVRHQLFQLYFRSEEIKKEFQGTGLGLFIARQLVYKMRGEIDLNSDYGQGSTFWFNVPLKKAVPSKPTTTALFSPSPGEEGEDQLEALQGLKLLIIDDNANSRQILLDEVRLWKIEATVVDSGKAGLALLREAVVKEVPYQLALIDAEIPELKDGLDLLQDIKAEPRLAGLLVVMMTTLQNPLESHILNQLAGYLDKPIFREDLLFGLLSAIKPQKPEEVEKEHDLEEDEAQALRWQVLLAEDNLINQEVAKTTLNQLDCHVQIAANGIEAIEAVEQQDFDLIVMDCNMPEVDGYVATQKIREYEKRQGKSRVPIIAFTADVMPSTRERCFTVGMDDYLTKPLIINELQTKIQKWLVTQPAKADSPKAEIRESVISNQLLETTEVSPEEEAGPLDIKVLQEMRHNLPASNINWIINLYLQELPTYLVTLQQAIANQNGEALYSAAHKFKGASAILGARYVVELCKILEQLGRNKTLDKVAEPLAQIEVECERIKQALEKQKQQIV
jgi:PAS domain S-box-containing protein